MCWRLVPKIRGNTKVNITESATHLQVKAKNATDQQYTKKNAVPIKYCAWHVASLPLGKQHILMDCRMVPSTTLRNA